MKKTHLYGAVAATMLLAPVTANVLAEENDSLSETQEAEVFSDGIVLTPEEGNQLGTTDDGSDNALGAGEGESTSLLEGTSNGSDKGKAGNLDAGASKEEKVSETDDTDNTELSGDETNLPDDFTDGTKELKADVSKVTVDDVCDQPVLKAEEFEIPEPVTMETTVEVVDTYGENVSYSITLKDYFSKYEITRAQIHNAETGTINSIDFSFDINKINMSEVQDLTRKGNDFSGTIYYDIRSEVEALNQKFGTKLTRDSSFLRTCIYNQKRKTWQIIEPGKTEDSPEANVYLFQLPNPEFPNPKLEYDEPDVFQESDIVQSFLRIKDSVEVVFDNKDTLTIKLTPAMLNVYDYANTKGRVGVNINIKALLANTKYNQDDYIVWNNSKLGGYVLLDEWHNKFQYAMIFKKDKGWECQASPDLLKQSISLTLNSNQQYKEILDVLSTLKVHIKDKNSQFEIQEFDFLPETFDLYYEERTITDLEQPVTNCRMYYDIYATKYIQKLEALTGKKYKLTDFEKTWHLSENSISIYDGKWYYNDPYLRDNNFYRVEPLFYVEEVVEPENPIKTEATFTKGNYEVKAESKEDLTGLEIVIDEVEADNNFGLTSDYQTIGYDIHFENEKGDEVNRTGKFIVRLPIPQQFVGKNVRLFHKENKDAPAKELTFKVIDGKYYEFETTSFSWFIVASQEPENPNEKPDQPNNPSDTNKPVVKPTVNEGHGTKVIPVKVETLRSVKEESNAEHSPNTGIAVHKTSSMFTGFMSVIGLGFLARKKRKF